MTTEQKKKEIEKIEVRLKKEMPRIMKEIAVYEKALKDGTLIANPKPATQLIIANSLEIERNDKIDY
ncbi:hypothetical protein M3O96_19100 [Aquiflexum sp. TKW24L]|uniref:hypothetical protein n=1 Tax=Aquiflexum sp. TKW24L TaxID=2942212 RepID=UPI0020BDE309|nr:hypothetical protein [Aquiflexum sp. TKW24L]MCL6261217.1 hypothetical protein [Aquiflexum sp. TKW24L]